MMGDGAVIIQRGGLEMGQGKRAGRQVRRGWGQDGSRFFFPTPTTCLPLSLPTASLPLLTWHACACNLLPSCLPSLPHNMPHMAQTCPSLPFHPSHAFCHLHAYFFLVCMHMPWPPHNMLAFCFYMLWHAFAFIWGKDMGWAGRGAELQLMVDGHACISGMGTYCALHAFSL